MGHNGKGWIISLHFPFPMTTDNYVEDPDHVVLKAVMNTFNTSAPVPSKPLLNTIRQSSSTFFTYIHNAKNYGSFSDI